MHRSAILIALFFIVFIRMEELSGAAPIVGENFATDPVANGRFIQTTSGTESSFTFSASTQQLTFVSDNDNSLAYYVSTPTFPIITDTSDASFSARFRILGSDELGGAAYIGLMTTQGLGDFGSGVVLQLNASPTSVSATPRVDSSAGPQFIGTAIPLTLLTDYFAVGHYDASTRMLTMDIYDGGGLVGTSVTAALPSNRFFSVNRIGLQNAGRVVVDRTTNIMTLTVDDLFTPAAAVPEPQTLSLLLVGVVFGIVALRMKHFTRS